MTHDWIDDLTVRKAARLFYAKDVEQLTMKEVKDVSNRLDRILHEKLDAILNAYVALGLPNATDRDLEILEREREARTDGFITFNERLQRCV